MSIGATSVGMEVQGEQNGRLCFTARSVSVFVDQGSKTKMPVSGHIREALVQCLRIHQLRAL
ncbi:MAG: hypothetical protein Q4G49_14760 [Paracoccus sp. (in: a-proteobacteria)]|nr:hypothetical protein [Paracoccus sp. (in: a-proteobacteria)]